MFVCLLDALALIVVRSKETYEPKPHPSWVRMHH